MLKQHQYRFQLMAKDVCYVCQKEIGMGQRFSPEKAWTGYPPDSKLCLEHYNERKSKDKEEGINAHLLKYSGENIKVVEIAGIRLDGAWGLVDKICSEGYTIKGVIERETFRTSFVILEKVR